MPDISETTLVALLKLVVEHLLSPTTPASAHLSRLQTQTPPALPSFLASWVEAPTTSATLRRALQTQLAVREVLPILEVLDRWLGWWARRGGGGGEIKVENVKTGDDKPRRKRMPINPFVALTLADDPDEVELPPRVEDVSLHLYPPAFPRVQLTDRPYRGCRSFPW